MEWRGDSPSQKETKEKTGYNIKKSRTKRTKEKTGYNIKKSRKKKRTKENRRAKVQARKKTENACFCGFFGGFW
jgi:hypothetical protein